MVSGDKKVFLDINIFASSPISSIFYALSIAFILSNKVLFGENMAAMKCSQSTLALYRINYKKKKKEAPWDFPGGPVVKTSCFQCGRHGVHRWSGN